MIHLARPTVSPVAHIVFTLLFCFHFVVLKSGDGRTDNTCENNNDYRGLAEWINLDNIRGRDEMETSKRVHLDGRPSRKSEFSHSSS